MRDFHLYQSGSGPGAELLRATEAFLSREAEGLRRVISELGSPNALAALVGLETELGREDPETEAARVLIETLQDFLLLPAREPFAGVPARAESDACLRWYLGRISDLLALTPR